GLPRPGDRPCEPMRPRAPGHRLLAACGLAGLVALLLFGLLAPAAGARPRQAGGPALTLVDKNTWLHDGEAFGATGRVTGAPAGAFLRGAGPPPRQGGGRARTLVGQNTWLHDGEAFGATVRVTGAPAGASLRVVAHG